MLPADERGRCQRRHRPMRRHRRNPVCSASLPSNITTIRSESCRISSRSSLTSSTAAPRLRAWTIRARISATAAKSRPKQGLATISRSPSLESSRASTARCTLPPDRPLIGRIGAGRLHAIRLDQLARHVAHRRAPQADAVGRGWRLVERAQRHVLRHRHVGDAGIAQRLLGQAGDLVPDHLRPGRRVALAMDLHAAGPGVTLAGQRLDQFALAVARDARHADDLAGADLERQVLDRELADIVGDRERLDLQHGLARRALLALDDGARLALADHHLGHGCRCRVRPLASCRPACRDAGR